MRRVAFLLLALFLALIFSGCGSPEQSVKMFLKYRIKGDIDAAKLYCTDGIDQRIDQGEFTVSALGFGNPYGTPISWEGVKGKINVLPQSETEDSAVLTTGTGPKQVTFTLQHEGGMWKISDIIPVEKPLGTPKDLAGMIEEAEELMEEFLDEAGLSEEDEEE